MNEFFFGIQTQSIMFTIDVVEVSHLMTYGQLPLQLATYARNQQQTQCAHKQL